MISNHDLLGVYVYIGLYCFLDLCRRAFGIDRYGPGQCAALAAETVDMNILSKCKATSERTQKEVSEHSGKASKNMMYCTI